MGLLSAQRPATCGSLATVRAARSLLAGSLLGACCYAHGQTNTPTLAARPVGTHLFSCPIPDLDHPVSRAVSAPNTNAVELSLETPSGDPDRAAANYRWMNGHDILTRTAADDLGGAYGWLDRNVLGMEVIKLRNVRLTGSIVTAIKRKNPLCLINPLIFAACW